MGPHGRVNRTTPGLCRGCRLEAFAGDLINPPELDILGREVKRVKKGRAVAIPAGKEAVGPRVIARP
jgi:hypothetical protein